MSAHLQPLQAGVFADFLLDRPGGLGMADELAERFPTIQRFDVFLGIALACAIHDADLAASEIELRQMSRQFEAALRQIEVLRREREQRGIA